MSDGNTSRWRMLEEWSSKIILLGGVLWLANATLLSIELFAGISIPGPKGVNSLVGFSGLVAAFVGILAFYPGLARRAPRLARIGAALLSISGVALAIILVWLARAILLNQPNPPGALLILSVIVGAGGFILFGIGGLRVGTPSGTVGLLVIAIPATLIGSLILVFGIYGGDSPDWTSPATSGVISVILLAIWYLLRSGPWPMEHR